MARVIRAADPGARVVKAVVRDATLEAQRVATQIHDAAARDGFAAGLAQAGALLVEAAALRAATLATAEHDVTTLALEVARRIMTDALTVDPSLIVGVVAPLLERVRFAGATVLRVHPEDRPALEAWIRLGGPRSEPLAALTLQSDAMITRGGCIVSTGGSEQDARIETQLSALAKALGISYP
jgi:flagellar biosynthesis/type III secretory pathway protein FliH